MHSSATLGKNDKYWNRENKGFLDEIRTAYITQDINAKLNLFKDGQIVDTHLLSPMLPTAMEQRWQIDRSMDGSVFYPKFNHRDDRITRNKNFHRVSSWRKTNELVYKVLKSPVICPGQPVSGFCQVFLSRSRRNIHRYSIR